MKAMISFVATPFGSATQTASIAGPLALISWLTGIYQHSLPIHI
jgi:hypothetical protein